MSSKPASEKKNISIEDLHHAFFSWMLPGSNTNTAIWVSRLSELTSYGQGGGSVDLSQTRTSIYGSGLCLTSTPRNPRAFFFSGVNTDCFVVSHI